MTMLAVGSTLGVFTDASIDAVAVRDVDDVVALALGKVTVGKPTCIWLGVGTEELTAVARAGVPTLGMQLFTDSTATIRNKQDFIGKLGGS